MQTPKSSIKSSSEGGRKISPRSVSIDATQRSSGRVVRQLKTSGLEASSSTSQPKPRTPKTASPKAIDRVSPRAPVTEPQKKRLGRVAELETQVTQLEDALRKVKEQLIVSESWKTQAKLDAEESRKELLDLTLKLEESQKLLARFSSVEPHDEQDEHNDEARLGKLQNLQIRKSTDAAALNAALFEIDQLKVKLETITESEATKTKQAESAYVEIQVLTENLSATCSLMEEMKNQLEDCKSSESQAQALASETLLQLETAKKTMEFLKSTSVGYNAIASELEQSRARVISLERIVDKMKRKERESECEEIISLKSELGKLKSADIRFKEEQSRQTLEIAAELQNSKAYVEELKANLMDKETECQCILDENEDLHAKLANLISGRKDNEANEDFNSLKAELTSLETELCKKSDENKKLKLEIKKMNGIMEASKEDMKRLKSKLTSVETEACKKSDENEKLKLEIKKMNDAMETSRQNFNSLKTQWKNAETELCQKSDENEKLKLEIEKKDGVIEVTKRNNDEIDERLEAMKMSNFEMEEELKRVKVQMSQWRKAAEAATAILCDEDGDNSRRMVVERAWSMGHYSPRKRIIMGIPCNVDNDDDDDDDDDDCDEDEDEYLKRKNGNMLKRIGELWKKPQNK